MPSYKFKVSGVTKEGKEYNNQVTICTISLERAKNIVREMYPKYSLDLIETKDEVCR